MGMKNLDKVLLAIKLESDRQTKLAEINCFDRIAEKAEISSHKLVIYLSELQDRGYIKYSISDNFIYLTKDGKKYIS